MPIVTWLSVCASPSPGPPSYFIMDMNLKAVLLMMLPPPSLSLAPIIGHVGDGNFHSMILLDPDNRKEVQLAKELTARMARLVITAGVLQLHICTMECLSHKSNRHVP